jgi:hypothetical protein
MAASCTATQVAPDQRNSLLPLEESSHRSPVSLAVGAVFWMNVMILRVGGGRRGVGVGDVDQLQVVHPQVPGGVVGADHHLQRGHRAVGGTV